MDLSSMGSWVKLFLNNDPSVVNIYTSANLCACLNQANLEVNREMLYIDSSGSVTTTSSSATYPLSASYMTNANHLAVRSVFYNGSKLELVSDEDPCWQYGETRPTNTPSKYRIRYNVIELDSYPAEAKTLEVKYWAKPVTLLNNGDAPELPSEYHMAIVYRACAYLTSIRADENGVNSFHQRYVAEMQNLKSKRADYDAYVLPLNPFNRQGRQHQY